MLSQSVIKIFLVGLLGGAADAVPGISGGTVYYVLGVYEDLLRCLNSCWVSICSSFSQRSILPLLRERSWRYLGVLVAGVMLSFLVLARFILYGLEHPFMRPILLSTFFGLVIGSICVCFRSIVHWRLPCIASMFIGGVLGAFLMSSPELIHEPRYTVPIHTVDLPEAQNVSEDRTSIHSVPHSAIVILKAQGLIADEDSIIDEDLEAPVPVKNIVHGNIRLFRPDLMAAGVLAISAMLLPGISGSFVLSVLGVYASILSALLDVVGGVAVGELRSVACFIVINVFAGICFGALMFSQTILWLFSKFHDGTHAFLSGCMIGSMWSIWPFQRVGHEIDPFHITKGVLLISKGNYCPSLQEVYSVWYVPCIIVIAAVIVVALDRCAIQYKRRLKS